ncbi:unnamed protein product [Clonostachys solani]|uniref:Uncharacterized protein n=1 Tax=Clonostachys solani TaxID=160281 RepID=A0A9N9ZER1_9HYPO|nr:unnamed protein product [Clonostachys solani]
MNPPGLKEMYVHPKKKTKLIPIEHRQLRSKPCQLTWAEANRVHYYWNAGLRTACWESRIVLTEYYTQLRKAKSSAKPGSSRKPSPPEEHLSSKNPPSEEEKNKIALSRATATLPVKYGRVYLDWWTADIVCFRFPQEHMAACVYFKWREFLTRLPFFQLPYASDLNLAFEFEDGWEKGLGETRESVCEHLSEASTRGLVMRAWWDWLTGRIPIWTRMYLINPRNDLPRHHRLANNFRYYYDAVYGAKYPSSTGDHRVFSDGERRYVESYCWDEKGPDFTISQYDLPICSFILKMERFCRPLYKHPIDDSLPTSYQHFFRVLRLLPTDMAPEKA